MGLRNPTFEFRNYCKQSDPKNLQAIRRFLHCFIVDRASCIVDHSLCYCFPQFEIDLWLFVVMLRDEDLNQFWVKLGPAIPL
jgi:hypothetical protein